MRPLFTLMVLLWTAVRGLALSYGTPGSSMTARLAAEMERHRDRAGALPRSWDEFNPPVVLPPESAYPVGSPAGRFAFVTDPIRLGDDRLLLVMRSPFRDVRRSQTWIGTISKGLGPRGRWAVLEVPGWGIRTRFLAEDEFREAYAKAGVPLPAPGDVSPWPHEVKHRKERLVQGLVAAGLVGLVGGWLWWRRKWRRSGAGDFMGA